jgi:hypothetical protein
MADDQHATPSRTDYTVHKGEVSLAVYRKRIDPAPGEPPRPVPFLVHGSSNSALSSFDLTVPGAGEYSTMNLFAGAMIHSIFTRDHPGTSDPAVAEALADADQTGRFRPVERTP